MELDFTVADIVVKVEVLQDATLVREEDGVSVATIDDNGDVDEIAVGVFAAERVDDMLTVVVEQGVVVEKNDVLAFDVSVA